MSEYAVRQDYHGEEFGAEVLAAAPFALAHAWVQEALARSRERQDVPEPMAMSFATVDAHGRPDVRTVLVRFFEPVGVGFVTSLDSAKGRQVAANPVAAASLTWPAMYRAIRMRGQVERIEEGVVRDYFVSRPWGSRISAWTSQQSQPLADRRELRERYERLARRYPDTGSPDDVPVPPGWGGLRLIPDEVEFWAGRPDRLHDRVLFTRQGPGTLEDTAAWSATRRQP